MMESENQMNTGIAQLCVFFLWFIGSFIGMIIFAVNDKLPIVAMIIGQYLLVFGIIIVRSGIKNKNLKPGALLVIAVGVGCIGGGAIFQFGNHAMRNMAVEVLPYAFMILGLSVVIGNYLYFKKKHESCTFCVEATCARIKEERRKEPGETRPTYLYCPVYVGDFRGETVTFCNEHYCNKKYVKEGEKREIYVNPENPQEFYEPKEEKDLVIFLYVLGSACVIIPLLTLIF